MNINIFLHYIEYIVYRTKPNLFLHYTEYIVYRTEDGGVVMVFFTNDSATKLTEMFFFLIYSLVSSLSV